MHSLARRASIYSTSYRLITSDRYGGSAAFAFWKYRGVWPYPFHVKLPSDPTARWVIHLPRGPRPYCSDGVEPFHVKPDASVPADFVGSPSSLNLVRIVVGLRFPRRRGFT